MRKAENVNAPNLAGWGIGAAAGLVCLGALVVIGDFDLVPAAGLGAALALIVGVILGLPWGSAPAAKAAAPVLGRAEAAAPAPVAEAVSGMAAVKSPAPAAKAAVPKGAPAEAAPVALMATPAPAAAKKAAAPSKTAAKPATKAAAKPAAKPKAAKPAAKAKPAGPVRLTAPRKGKADDLKEIEGIGPALEKLVNGMGFYHFDQIASWSDADVALVDAEMTNFKGRITRDKWVAQAKIIISEGLEAFRERAKTNNY